jgi:transcription antitermination factor NusG
MRYRTRISLQSYINLLFILNETCPILIAHAALVLRRRRSAIPRSEQLNPREQVIYGMDRIGTRHASNWAAKHVVAYLHRANSQLKQAVFSTGREYQQNFLNPSKRFLSDGGEALSQVINASTSATTASGTLPPCLHTTGRPPHWYAVYTSPRHEKRVHEHLGHRRVASFLPLFRTVHRWKNGCKAQVELPLFPGYVFVNIPRTERVRVLDVPGVISFVGPKSEPAQLSDFEIERLRSGLHLQKVEPYRGLAIGQKIRINAGALQGLEGTLVRNANGLRVVITVNLIQQSVAVELDADAVDPV